jgi:subtilase family serine protease
MIMWAGDWFKADGTSAAAPSVAGIFALLNDARIQAKMPPLGFVNPRELYGHRIMKDTLD